MTRGRRPSLDPKESLHIRVQAQLLKELRSLFYSEVEERVPYDALNRFFDEQIRRALKYVSLDLAPYTGFPPGLHIIRTDKGTAETLRKLLEGKFNVS